MKNKKTKNKTARKTTLLRGAAKSLRKLSKGTTNSIGRLSTAQKVVGGATLLALGLSYLNKRRRATGDSSAPSSTPDAAGAEQNLAGLNEEESGSL